MTVPQTVIEDISILYKHHDPEMSLGDPSRDQFKLRNHSLTGSQEKRLKIGGENIIAICSTYLCVKINLEYP